MTTLYRPVLIESAEQAEALPIGTATRHTFDDGTSQVCTRMANGWWCTDETNIDGTPYLVPHDRMIGDTALEPIEAEEEVVVNTADLGLDPEAVYQYDDPDLIAAVRTAAKRTRLVTTWEKA